MPINRHGETNMSVQMGEARPRSTAPRAWWPILVLPIILSACQGLSEPVSLNVRNDRHESVAVVQCRSKDCSRTGDRWSLKPGEVGQVLVELKAGYNSYEVVDSNGVVIGC